MSGFTVALNKRHRCEASGKEYTRFLRRGVPNAHGMMNCPLCNKGVTLKAKETGGKPVVIPRHLEQIVGL